MPLCFTITSRNTVELPSSFVTIIFVILIQIFLEERRQKAFYTTVFDYMDALN